MALGLCGLAWRRRLHGLSEESFWLDQAVSARWAALSLGEILATIHTDVHPPLYHLGLYFWSAIAGRGE